MNSNQNARLRARSVHARVRRCGPDALRGKRTSAKGAPTRTPDAVYVPALAKCGRGRSA